MRCILYRIYTVHLPHATTTIINPPYVYRCPNWQKGYTEPCKPGQEPTILTSTQYLPTFFGSPQQKQKQQQSNPTEN